jgi:hypothetical protein
MRQKEVASKVEERSIASLQKQPKETKPVIDNKVKNVNLEVYSKISL